VVFISVVFLSRVFFISFSHNLYCFVLFHCIMLCYCYGSFSDHFGPSAFNKFGIFYRVQQKVSPSVVWPFSGKTRKSVFIV